MLYKTIIILLCILGGLSLLKSKNWIINFSILFILLFSLGYRTWKTSLGITIHPIDLFMLFFALKISIQSNKFHINPIVIGIVFVLFWAIVNSFLNGINFEDIFIEFKGFILIYFIYLFVSVYVSYDLSVIPVYKWYTFSMLIICFLGLLEFYFPTVASVFGPLYNLDISSSISENTDNFKRANFTNWGAATVGHIILLGFPILFFLRKHDLTFKNNYIYWSSLVLELMAIYATGNRADWIALLIMVVCFLLYYKKNSNRFLIALWIVLLFIFILPYLISFLPDSAITRFISGISAIGGGADEAMDSSGYQRNFRVTNAIELMIANPFGAGLGSAGWVHADFLQFAATTGWLGGGLFLYLYLNQQYNSFKTFQSTFISDYDRDLLMCLIIVNIGVGFNFLINGIYNLPQTGAPYFIMMALNYYFNRRIKYNIKFNKFKTS